LNLSESNVENVWRKEVGSKEKRICGRMSIEEGGWYGLLKEKEAKG